MYIRLRSTLHLIATTTTISAQPDGMSNHEPNPPTSSRDAQRTHEGTSCTNDAYDVPMSSTSFLDELREDDTTTVYSYFSTVSTNYTISNLPGPGRLLGNLFSRAGSALEKRLGKLINRATLKAYAEAVAVLQELWRIECMFESEDELENEMACEVLLICAKYAFFSCCHTSLIHDAAFRKDRTTSTSRFRPSRTS